MPSAGDLQTDLATYGGPFFTEFYNIVKYPLGLLFAVGAVALLIGLFIHFAKSAAHHKS